MADNTTSFELYKLEYEKGAERYENIYKSVWTNFSYLTVVAGGIIAFGSKYLPLSHTIIFASIPLVFWYLAVFEPGNRYGDQVVDRLSEVEKVLNEIYKKCLTTNTMVSSPVDISETLNPKLQHFTLFNSRKEEKPKTYKEWFSRKGLYWICYGFRRLRVRYIVRLFIPLLAFLLWCYFPKTNSDSSGKADTITIDQQQKPLDIRVAGLDIKELEKLSQDNVQIKNDLRELNHSLEAIADDLKTLKPTQERNRQ